MLRITDMMLAAFRWFSVAGRNGSVPEKGPFQLVLPDDGAVARKCVVGNRLDARRDHDRSQGSAVAERVAADGFEPLVKRHTAETGAPGKSTVPDDPHAGRDRDSRQRLASHKCCGFQDFHAVFDDDGP